LSFALAFAFFAMESFVFRTAGLGAGTISPFIVSTTGFLWMLSVYFSEEFASKAH
jgi:hypothetical protein